MTPEEMEEMIKASKLDISLTLDIEEAAAVIRLARSTKDGPETLDDVTDLNSYIKDLLLRIIDFTGHEGSPEDHVTALRMAGAFENRPWII